MTESISRADAIAPRIWAEGAHAVLEVDPAIYPLPAAIAAGYRFTDRAYVWLQSADRKDRYFIFLKPKTAADALDSLVGAFANEILDQVLRHQLEHRFSPLRTIITAQAFAEGNLLEVVDRENGRGPSE